MPRISETFVLTFSNVNQYQYVLEAYETIFSMHRRAL